MSTEPASMPMPKSERLVSLDALRGFDMFWIIGGREVIVALARWSGWHQETIERQFQHVPWEGFVFYDLIFPLFLFVVGAVLPFSIAKTRSAEASKSSIHGRILWRTLLLFALGLIVNRDLDLNPETFRWSGVLQRIAITYAAGALLVVHTGIRTQAVIFVALLAGYWAILAFVAAPGFEAGDYSMAGCLPGFIDRQYLPGHHVAYGFGDNEGLLSTMGALASALLGVLAGHWLRSSQTPWRKVNGLILVGGICVLLGTAWGLWLPIIKNIWTSSFVLVAGGWSLLLLGAFYALMDVLGYKKWAFFFVVIGTNAITIYVARRIFDFSFTAKFLFAGIAQHLGGFEPVLLALGVVAVEWLLLLFLYRNRLFLRV